jgi:hypothetical protein
MRSFNGRIDEPLYSYLAQEWTGVALRQAKLDFIKEYKGNAIAEALAGMLMIGESSIHFLLNLGTMIRRSNQGGSLLGSNAESAPVKFSYIRQMKFDTSPKRVSWDLLHQLQPNYCKIFYAL